MRYRAGSAVSAILLTAVAGCVTSLPTAAGPSLAPSLPPEPTPSPASSLPSSSLPQGSSRPPSPPTGSSRSLVTGTTTTTVPGPSRTSTAAHVPSSAELRRALLGGDDLAGFDIDNGTGDGTGGAGGCPALDTDFSGGASASADVLLVRKTPTAYLRERLRQLTAANARAALRRVRGAPDSCPSYTTTVSGLGKVTVTVSALGAPRTGDDTTAVRITMRPENVAVVAIENLVVARRGGTLIVLTHTGVGSIEDGLTSSAVAKAYQKTLRAW